MFASRIGPPKNAAFSDRVLKNTRMVKSMLLKHPSHHVSLWMKSPRINRFYRLNTLPLLTGDCQSHMGNTGGNNGRSNRAPIAPKSCGAVDLLRMIHGTHVH
jgi:hypothetical protein